MFSMFGRTGAPTNRGGGTKGQFFPFFHCSTGPQQNVDDDYCVCPTVSAPTVSGEGSRRGRGLRGIHMLGPPHFSEQGPRLKLIRPGLILVLWTEGRRRRQHQVRIHLYVRSPGEA